MSAAKQEVLNLLQSLPDDCSLEDIQYHLYVALKIKKSEARIQTEGTISHEEVEQRLSKWVEG